ncbi:hypothetical protein KEM54_001211, partial [Ascosphaera aggregata]
DDLSFSCICSNGDIPNATEYSQTIPYYLCTERNNQCVKDCPNNNGDCQFRCRADNPCGAKSPKRLNTTTTTATGTATSGATDSTGTSGTAASLTTDDAASSTTSGAVYTGMAGEEPADSGASGFVGLSPVCGYAVLLSAFLAGFAVIM